jgi:hypothetical protein
MADEDDDDLEKDADSETPEADEVEETPSNKEETESEEKPPVAKVDVKNSPEKEDEETDKETSHADDIGQQETEKKSPDQEIHDDAEDLLGKLPKTDVQEEAPTKLDRYQNFINEYRKLQDQRQKSDLATGLAAAGAKIGQSMAGKFSGQFNPDLTGIKLAQEQASRPVSDLEQQQVVQGRGMQVQSEQNANDPNSPQSKLTRNYLKTRLGLDLPDDVSAADAQALLKTVGRPVQTKYQKVNGTYTDEKGQQHRVSANYDPTTHSYVDVNGNKLPDNFVAEGLNPYQFTRDPITGNLLQVNKSRGGTPTQVQGAALNAAALAQNPNQLYAAMNPNDRKELNDKILPAFNKETEKTQQRLNHVPVILQRLQEAQTNPAALPQLKAELARFDVGDQRLAVQELNMFAVRQGYKGFSDFLNAHTTGTISPDFANQMGQAITHVSDNLKEQMSQAAEKHAMTMINRLPEGQKVNQQAMAGLVYGGYKPTKKESSDEEMRLTQDGRMAVFNPKTKQFIRWANPGQQ